MMRERAKERTGRWWRGAATLAAAAAVAVAGAALLPAPASAGIPGTPTQAILSRAVSPASLRAQLDSLANAVAARDPILAGEARYYQGMSFGRAGLLDSAITAYQSALSLRKGRQELLALADARLLREAPGDAATVLREFAPAIADAGSETAYTLVWLQRRLAWAHFLAGHADSAAALFEASEDMPGLRLEWRYRMALAALATGDARKAYTLLIPVAVASRKQDADVMQKLADAAAKLGGRNLSVAQVDAEIHGRDARAQRLFESWGGRRVLFSGTDGFRLTGIVVPAGGPPPPARAAAAVVLMAANDTLAAYDSLVIALRGHGVSTILVPARGTDWSVSPACPLPDAWEGREEKLERQCALDVRPALRQLAAVTPVDTTSYLIVGTTSTCVSAAQAARLDRSVRALLLVSPFVPEVDRGTMCADLGASSVPCFYQLAQEDFDFSYEVADMLYQAGNHSASRVVEGTQPGHGVAQYDSDSTLLPRFLLWLDDAFKSRSPARATPPAARRRG